MTKRCSKCILPETIPNIKFDEQDICNYCYEFDTEMRQFKLANEEKEKKFSKIIQQAKEEAKKNNAQYDVLVPVSGGRDSSYVLWKLATQYNLNVLCVNYANPYSSEQALKNIENLTNFTHSKLVRFSYKNKMHEKSFESNLKAWIKKPDLGSLSLICISCKPMYLEFYRIAKENKIKLIVDGSNIFEVTSFKMEAQGGRGTKSLLSNKTVSNVLKKIIENVGYFKVCNIAPAIKTFLSLNGSTPYLKFKYPNIVKIGYFYFFPYREQEVNETLKAIGWKKADENNSPWRFDCEIDSIKNYIYQRVVGATEKDDLFSKYIRYGVMKRDDAIKRLNEGTVNSAVVTRILNNANIQIYDLDKACDKIKTTKSI